jgi:hypothetical protein
LAQRGRVGITSTNDKLQKLQSLDGKIVDVLVDLRRRVSAFVMVSIVELMRAVLVKFRSTLFRCFGGA